MKARISILNGLEVTIRFSIDRDERDIDGGYVGEWQVVEVKGRKVSDTAWLYTRIYATKGEEDRILAMLLSGKYNLDIDDIDYQPTNEFGE